jgi:hypothetical protein
MKKQSDDERSASWVSGPNIEPADELLVWLSKNAAKSDGERRRLRVPVLVHFDEDRLAIAGAFLGAASEVSKRVALHLDDSALGISLRDRLRKRCAETQPTCVVWLEGYWGSLVAPADTEATRPPYPFAVLRVLVESPRNTTNILVEP